MTDYITEVCAVCGFPEENHKGYLGKDHPFELRTISSTGGEKGVKEERHSLIPVEALATVAKLYGFGAKKYDTHNWRKGYEWSKSYDAMQRHSNEFWKGVDLDPETGLPHLSAVVFHALTLITFMQEQPRFDDRYKPTLPLEASEVQAQRLSKLREELRTQMTREEHLVDLRSRLQGDPNHPAYAHLKKPNE